MLKKLIKNKTLQNKTVLITGTTSGIGLACVKHLARLGCNIIACSRNNNLAESQLLALSKKYANLKFNVYHLDLQNLKTINSLCENLKKDYPNGIDFVINNAGIFARPKKETEFGFEQHFFTNCIAPLYLTKKLMPLLNENSKVVFVSSISIKNSKINFKNIDLKNENNKIKIYANSKLWLTNYILHHKKLNPDSKIQFQISQPGICSSSLLSSKNGSVSKFIFGVCNIGMKILFHSASKAAICEIAGLAQTTSQNEWIGPWCFGIWGNPKTTKLSAKNAKPEISTKCYNLIENTINKL
jgi:NAD(P)-dependent dehydrogenase (short-subunit alcohol dehydrogenase family)